MKKLITLIALVALVAVLSCSENEVIRPEKKPDPTVAPPPIYWNVTIDARMSASTTTPVDIYYMTSFPLGTWTYVATLTGTNCQANVGTFSVLNGSTVYIMVWDGTYNIAYHARAGTCASKNDPYYCGEQSSGPDMYHTTVSGGNAFIGMHVLVNTFTNQPMICAF